LSIETFSFFAAKNWLHNARMKYGYARVSTDGQSVDAQVRQLTKAGFKKVFREVANGGKTDRAEQTARDRTGLKTSRCRTQAGSIFS